MLDVCYVMPPLMVPTYMLTNLLTSVLEGRAFA